MGLNEASELVNETHGLYIPMKKKIFNGQVIKKPEWINKLPREIKQTALLVGQWTDLEGDQEIISNLSKMKYEDYRLYDIFRMIKHCVRVILTCTSISLLLPTDLIRIQ